MTLNTDLVASLPTHSRDRRSLREPRTGLCLSSLLKFMAERPDFSHPMAYPKPFTLCPLGNAHVRACEWEGPIEDPGKARRGEGKEEGLGAKCG